jgi:flagellar basal-body rod protein FlgB
MTMPAIPLLDALRERMSWLSARQGLLSQNVANSDQPGYSAKDLKPLDFASVLKRSAESANQDGALAVTDPRHIALPAKNESGFEETDVEDETQPGGNTVSLEEETMKVADTQAQYQAAANLYAKAIGMMRTAIDRTGV